MRMKPKMKQLEALLNEIIADDAKQRSKARKSIPPEVVEAMDYFVLWGRARSRPEALFQLAQPLSGEVIAKVRALDIEHVGRATPEPRTSRARAK